MSEQVYRDVTDDEVLEVLLWHEQMAQWDRNTALRRAEQRGLEQGIAALIQVCTKAGMKKEQVLAELRQNFDLSEKKAVEYYQKYQNK